MDPSSAWEELLDLIAAGSLSEAQEKADSLILWLDREGFPPQVFGRILPHEWNRHFCYRICRTVLNAM